MNNFEKILSDKLFVYMIIVIIMIFIIFDIINYILTNTFTFIGTVIGLFIISIVGFVLHLAYIDKRH